MPKRRIDQETIEQALNCLENIVPDQYSPDRGNQETQSSRATAQYTPAGIIKTPRSQLHSPLLAAAILARLATHRRQLQRPGLNRQSKHFSRRALL